MSQVICNMSVSGQYSNPHVQEHKSWSVSERKNKNNIRNQLQIYQNVYVRVLETTQYRDIIVS